MISTTVRYALTNREMQVVRLLATGATNQQIAVELGISINTVKKHVRNSYIKLGVGGRVECAIMAVREGWFAPIESL